MLTKKQSQAAHALFVEQCERAIAALEQGHEFVFQNCEQGHFCAEANFYISCKLYDWLRSEHLIRNGKKWSPEQQEQLLQAAENVRQENKRQRLEYWHNRIVEAQDSNHRERRTKAIIEEIWDIAGSIAITEQFDGTE